MIMLAKNTNYRKILSANLISALGDSIQDIVLMWYLYTLTDSVLIAALSLIINYVPKVIFSPITGVISDRYNKKNILVICDFLNGICAIMLAVCIILKASIFTIFLISLIMSIASAFYLPTSMSIIPIIVESDEIIITNSINSTITNIINVVGPILAGILYSIISTYALFIFNGVSFFISAIIESRLKYAFEKTTNLPMQFKFKKIFNEFYEGFIVMTKEKFILFNAIIGGGLINFFLAPISLYIPVYVKSFLGESSLLFGVMNSAITIGSIIASCILIWAGIKCNRYILIVIGYIFEGVSFIILGVSNKFIISLVSLIFLGISISITAINLNTVVQEKFLPEVLGRCMSIVMLISNISIPLGYFIGAYAVEKYSIKFILILSGVSIAICGILSSYILKKYND